MFLTIDEINATVPPSNALIVPRFSIIPAMPSFSKTKLSFKKFSSLNFRELATMAPTSTLEPLEKITPFGFIRITFPFASKDP